MKLIQTFRHKVLKFATLLTEVGASLITPCKPRNWIAGQQATRIPKTDVSGGLKLPQSAAANKEFAAAALTGILADAWGAR
jgi:hypothetical protein